MARSKAARATTTKTPPPKLYLWIVRWNQDDSNGDFNGGHCDVIATNIVEAIMALLNNTTKVKLSEVSSVDCINEYSPTEPKFVLSTEAKTVLGVK